MLNVFLVLVVFNNQGIEFLGSCCSHLDKGEGKWYRVNKRGMDGCQMIGSIVIREKRGIQRERSQIRVSEMGRVHKCFLLKMIDITRIKVKRGTQWDRSQISLSTGRNV
jgi:hypothetical protein